MNHFVLLSLFLLTSCTLFQNNAKHDEAPDAQILQTAENLQRSGDAAGAVRLLREAQSSQPDNPLLLSHLGYALIAANESRQAVMVFDRLIALSPDNAGAYSGKAIAFDKSGNHFAAQELYREALKFSPDSISVKNNLAMSMILNDQIDQAITVLETLNRQSPNNNTIRQNLALAYGIKGDNQRALALNLQDLSPAEAQENLAFYEQYKREHKKREAATAAPAPQQIGFMNTPAAAAAPAPPLATPDITEAAPTAGGTVLPPLTRDSNYPSAKR